MQLVHLLDSILTKNTYYNNIFVQDELVLINNNLKTKFSVYIYLFVSFNIKLLLKKFKSNQINALCAT